MKNVLLQNQKRKENKIKVGRVMYEQDRIRTKG